MDLAEEGGVLITGKAEQAVPSTRLTSYKYVKIVPEFADSRIYPKERSVINTTRN